jgi:tetratricopeptide (TPR) repeat protein
MVLDNTSQAQTTSSSQGLSAWVGMAAVVIVAAGALWLYYGAPSASDQLTPAAALRESNSTYTEASALYDTNDFKAAQSKYEEALPQAKNPAEEAQIKLRIAHTVRDQGDMARAVQLYKEITANNEYPPMTQAYAAQAIAVIAGFTRDAALREEIFKGDKYSALLVKGSIPSSNRNLFEYAASLYPLALSELQVALWYAGALQTNAKENRGFTEDKIAQYRSLIADRMQLADVDMKRTENNPDDAVLRPEILRVRALTLGALFIAGYESREQVDRAFVEAFEANARYGAPGDGNMRLWYGHYLATFKGRRAELVGVISPLYTDPTYRTSRIGAFLAAERDNSNGAKTSLVRVATADPGFKEFLISLGWEDADFVGK